MPKMLYYCTVVYCFARMMTDSNLQGLRSK
jgi:hypothetical protein